MAEKFYPKKDIDKHILFVKKVLDANHIKHLDPRMYMEGISTMNRWGKYQYPIKLENKHGFLVCDFVFNIEDPNDPKNRMDIVFVVFNRMIKWSRTLNTVLVYEADKNKWEAWKPELTEIWQSSLTKKNNILILLGIGIDKYNDSYLKKCDDNIYLASPRTLGKLLASILDL